MRVALDKNPHRTVTIPLIAPQPRDGADSGDYAAPTEVVFNVGETSKDVTVTAVDDSVDDDGESVELTFGRLPDRRERRRDDASDSTDNRQRRQRDRPLVSLADRHRRRQRDLHGRAGLPADCNRYGVDYRALRGPTSAWTAHHCSFTTSRLGYIEQSVIVSAAQDPRRDQRLRDTDAHGDRRGL